MKNPVLAIIALVALAGILFAQGPPSSISAHSVVRQVELVGPIQVEGIVPLRDHISIPYSITYPAEVSWTCPPGIHAQTTRLQGSGLTAAIDFASGITVNVGQSQGAGDGIVLQPGDTLRIGTIFSSPGQTGIIQLAVEYD